MISHFNLTTFRDRWGNPPRVTSPTWGPPAPCKQALSIISIVVYSEWTKIALRAVTIYRPETYTNIREFLTFVWLLSWKCHVCLSFVIKMRKMTKLRKKLQSSYFDVIRALGIVDLLTVVWLQLLWCRRQFSCLWKLGVYHCLFSFQDRTAVYVQCRLIFDPWMAE